MSHPSHPGRGPERREGPGIAVAFGVSALASLGLTVLYGFGGQPQIEGILLFIALGGLGAGLILWGKQLMPNAPFVEERKLNLGRPEARAEVVASLEEAGPDAGRRSFLAKMLGGALGALGLAALFPIRSLGTAPGRALFRTPWAGGGRVVTIDGEPVPAGDFEVGQVLTIVPEGNLEAGDSQVILIRLEPGEYEPPPGREDWSPEGFVAFSKVCTHAGCPVGLYQAGSQELFCPCHQSVFAVLQAAAPTAGPATRPLPQLPLRIDEDGFVAAQGDFVEPVGPGFWNRPSA